MRIKILLSAMMIGILISGCGRSPATQEPMAEPIVVPPTNTSVPPSPTAIPSTETPASTPTNTPLPAGLIFRDDFNGSLQPGWRWELEDPSRWSFVGVGGNQWLQLVGNDGRSNVLLRDVPQGDFTITAHIAADPFQNFHQANIFIFEDLDNYIVLNTGYCAPCSTGGPGFYMETVADGGNSRANVYMIPRDPSATDVYLRIVLEGETISGYYATAPNDWQRLGRFGNFFTLNSIGLSATNSSPPEGTPEDIVAQFDFFEVSQP
ncbi:MAG: hypothetical protein IT314_08315 [Anaerolineales bacterium]|nr:hypothetical protein [Anaerolineales bacterium]